MLVIISKTSILLSVSVTKPDFFVFFILSFGKTIPLLWCTSYLITHELFVQLRGKILFHKIRKFQNFFEKKKRLNQKFELTSTKKTTLRLGSTPTHNAINV